MFVGRNVVIGSSRSKPPLGRARLLHFRKAGVPTFWAFALGWIDDRFHGPSPFDLVFFHSGQAGSGVQASLDVFNFNGPQLYAEPRAPRQCSLERSI